MSQRFSRATALTTWQNSVRKKLNMKTSILTAGSWILLMQLTGVNAYADPVPRTGIKSPALADISPSIKVASLTPAKDAMNMKPIERQQKTRKKWGVDKDHEEEYWFNEKIHTLGNTGVMGGLHAAIAPAATKMIDALAYKGVDVRSMVAKELASMVQTNKARVIDLCCGVGMSTRALQSAFPDAIEVIGVDTSPEMVSMAQAITLHEKFVKPITESLKAILERIDETLHRQSLAVKKAHRKVVATCLVNTKFLRENAEDTHLPSKSFDLVTVMYGFHEIPRKGRARILAEARRLLSKGGILALIDIAPEYSPSQTMLKGEPYVKEYQEAIDRQLRMAHGFTGGESKTLVPGHVNLWTLRRA